MFSSPDLSCYRSLSGNLYLSHYSLCYRYPVLMKIIPCYLFTALCLMFCQTSVAQETKSYDEAIATVEVAWESVFNTEDSLLNELRQSVVVLKASPKTPDSIMAQAYVQLGYSAASIREYAAAESAIKLAKPYLDRGRMSRQKLFNCYAYAAGALTRLRSFEAAEPLAKRAVELATTPNDKIDILSRYAYCFLGQNDLESALEILDEAVALEGAADDKQVARIMNNYGVLLTGLGDCPGAMKKFTGAIRLAGTAKEKVRPHMMRANCLSEAGARDSALLEINQAIRLMAPEAAADLPISEVRFGEDLSERDRELALTLVSERSRLLFEIGNVAEATATFPQQNDILGDMREVLVTDYSRRISNGMNRWAFDRMVSYSLGKFAAGADTRLLWEALAESDRARAYTLQLNRANKERSLTQRETELLEEIARLEREDDVAPAIANARLELDRIRTVQARPSMQAADAAVLQERLSLFLQEQDADAIIYHVSDTVAWAVHLPASGRPAAWRIPTTDSLRSQVESWRETIRNSAYKQKSLRSPAEQDSLDREYIAQGEVLARMLLPGELAGKKLILLPDGPLHFLPFAALPLGTVSFPLDYGAVTYLSSGRDLQSAFSLNLLTAPVSPIQSTDNNLIAFAPEFRGEATPGMVSRGVGNTRNLPALQPLAAAKAEVETIAGLVPGSEKVIGAAADRQRFLAAAPSARVLHLSAHGMVDAEKPERSFVAFSQPGDSINTEELLYLNDLYTLSMNAELTVLSACETSLGKLSPGDLPLTMGGAFAAAGARSTLTTLWQVDDAATKEVMVDFYRNLMDGRSRAEALQRAQGARRETDVHQHPYFWAGVTLQGEAGPLDLDPGIGWWLWVIGVLVLGVLLLFLKGNGRA